MIVQSMMAQTPLPPMQPVVPVAQPKMDPNLPTVFFVGDSTVKNGRDNGAGGLWGWANPIAASFDRKRINTQNRALGGRSSRTFISEGLWDKVLADMKSGDFVLIQFGHNDSSPVNDTSRARGTIKGTGEETTEIDNMLTGKHEVVHTYGWYIRRYIADAKAKGATVVVLSPVPRNNWTEGKVNRASNDYSKWAAESARAGRALFIDLNELIARRYEADGQEKVSAEYFTAKDHTHTTLAGAKVNAACVIEGLKGLKDCKLNGYLLPATH